MRGPHEHRPGRFRISVRGLNASHLFVKQIGQARKHNVQRRQGFHANHAYEVGRLASTLPYAVGDAPPVRVDFFTCW